MSNVQEATARHFPEHGPIDPKTGKEVLLSLKNVDITFGKGDKALKAVSNASFDIYKGETFSPDRRVRLRQDHHWPRRDPGQPLLCR